MPFANPLADVAKPFAGRNPVVRTRSLVDTMDHTDWNLLGLTGAVQPDEKDGLLAVLKEYADGYREVVITGPEGEIELPYDYAAMLVSELRRAGVGQ